MKSITYWIVNVGKKEYKLTQEQYDYMQEMNTKQGKTFFWFDNFSINLSMTSSIDKTVEHIDDVPDMAQLPSGIVDKEKIDRMRQELVKKLTMSI